MAKHHILVIGAGVAGPVTAYWLAKAGFQVTVIERSSNMFKYGQGVDINGPAQEVVEKMGLLDKIKSKTTGEKGVTMVDDDARPLASIDGGVTQEIEIMRGDLAEILTKAAMEQGEVAFKYDMTVEQIKQEHDHVNVKFGKSGEGTEGSFYAVIGADGFRSRTRALAFDPKDLENCFKAKDIFIAYFDIKAADDDAPYARLENAVGGRTVLVRPVTKERSSAYVSVTTKSERLEQVVLEDKQTQKATLAEMFEDIGGLAPRVMKEMEESENFYFERVAQIKLPRWSSGRCVLVGDAGYATGPITGEGSNIAIVGGYVLAGELSEQCDNPPSAFRAYEDRLRTYVDKAQEIPLGGAAPRLLNPDTRWGIWTLRAAFRLFAWTGVWKLIDPGEAEKLDLPAYAKLHSS
ncbi:hypothetical protein BAUCODRAFT_37305 [Baudoinia panamericana UAMH 10762]|uniref:FAD-binding domain-containing protein n=1 Tax=Baudoinia panamericana (strain UAMH 10762) TaxID=717646 RepID=M2MAX0_BAUPA|nr:uncharacterized protein BAUCODRAFT_37305 [Baudoinia panamericana UAMH 10762]EMC93621.1 hypothetical protein BAUCODRAFT_37305 [Baudoinia panamericana UAMH 10762]